MDKDFFNKQIHRDLVRKSASKIQTLEQISSTLPISDEEFRIECFKNPKLFRVIIKEEAKTFAFERKLYTKGYNDFLSKKITKPEWDAINDRYKLFFKHFESMSLTFFVRRKYEKSFDLNIDNGPMKKPVWSPEFLNSSLNKIQKERIN